MRYTETILRQDTLQCVFTAMEPWLDPLCVFTAYFSLCAREQWKVSDCAPDSWKGPDTPAEERCPQTGRDTKSCRLESMTCIFPLGVSVYNQTGSPRVCLQLFVSLCFYSWLFCVSFWVFCFQLLSFCTSLHLFCCFASSLSWCASVWFSCLPSLIQIRIVGGAV